MVNCCWDTGGGGFYSTVYSAQVKLYDTLFSSGS